MKKDNYDKNIKVTLNVTKYSGEVVRTSTTLNYGICDYYFGRLLYPVDADKAKKDKRYKDPRKRYRQWLEGVVREWSKTQNTADSSILEMFLLNEIYNFAYNKAIELNTNSMGLKFD